MPPAKVMIIRHAEKPGEGRDGIGPDGRPDEESLSVPGWRRSGALVRFFAPVDGHFARPGIAKPEMIFASRVGPGSMSKRPYQTVAPLARFLGLTVEQSWLYQQTNELAAAVVESTGVLLVSWEHKVIRELVAALIGSAPFVPEWPDSRFDMVYVLDRVGASWSLTQVPQLLFTDDSMAPF